MHLSRISFLRTVTCSGAPRAVRGAWVTTWFGRASSWMILQQYEERALASCLEIRDATAAPSPCGGCEASASHPTPLLYMRSPRWTEKPVMRAPLHQHGDVWNPEASLGRSDTPRPMPSPRQQAATLPWRQDAYSTASPYPWPVSFPITFHSNRKKGFKSRHCLSCPPERESLSL